MKLFNKNGDEKKKDTDLSELRSYEDFLQQSVEAGSFLKYNPRSDDRLVLIKYQNAADSESGVNSLRAGQMQKRREIHSLLLFVFFLFVTIITLSQILVMHSSTSSSNFNQIKLMQEELRLMDLSIDKMLKEKHVLPIEVWIALKKYNENIKLFSSYMENLDHSVFMSHQNFSNCQPIFKSSFFNNLIHNENLDISNLTKILTTIDHQVNRFSNQTTSNCLKPVLLNLLHILNAEYSSLREQNYKQFAKLDRMNLINETLKHFTNRSSFIKNNLPIRDVDALMNKYQKNQFDQNTNRSLCDPQPPILYGRVKIEEKKANKALFDKMGTENAQVKFGGYWSPKNCQARHKYFLLTSLIGLVHLMEKPLQRRICYFANWAPYRELEPALYPDQIDADICTHIHYAFAKIDSKTLDLVPTEEHDMNWTEKTKMPLFIRLYSLKRRNPFLKILLAVGGWSAKSDGFNMATRSALNRSKFINNTIKLLREWNFDGIDLDWEFPGEVDRGADKLSKQNFNYLVNDFRQAVNYEVELSGKKKLLVTSAVAADPAKIDNGYIVDNLCRQLDYISIMTYDYHGTWDNETGLNSPLYGRDANYYDQNQSYYNWKNANFSINYWISQGCPPEKINFGLAAYGRSFTLKNETAIKVGSPVLKGGIAGAYTKEEGIYSYFEICEKIKEENWKKHWDDKQQSVYATHADQWVGFDNQRSIALKVKWAFTMSLGGTMLWTLDFDDYTGQFCDEGPFPIANAIRAVFEEFNNFNLTEDLDTSTTTAIATTTDTSTLATTFPVSLTSQIILTSTAISLSTSKKSAYRKTFPFIINNDDNQLSINYNSFSHIDADSITIIFKNNSQTNLNLSKSENFASQEEKNCVPKLTNCFSLNLFFTILLACFK